ncbi:MAG TPA: hypothetical protein VNY27_07785 [Solirubrobacteraceae bacterium]|jgi:hypothetical protein|nr:hypothetical protein [Solirubrobacteraceae bacterium]
MDALILSSEGAYLDRSEFLAEAIADRLAEEAHAHMAPEAAEVTSIDEIRAVRPETMTSDEAVAFGDWAADGSPVTLPGVPGPATNFGLHNRDLPTIWALDWLGRLVSEAGRPITWAQYLSELVPRAWATGSALQTADLANGAPAKSAAGFPTNKKKHDAAEQRFLAHSVGSVAMRKDTSTATRNDGPLFVFRLVGLVVDGNAVMVAPTPEAVVLLRDLRRANASTVRPLPPEAWAAFSSHLERSSPEEIAMWRRVLNVLVDKPGRTAVATRCSWWAGSIAETNAMSYIARGREWGLVEPKMVDGHYDLTELGTSEVEVLKSSGKEP